MGDIDNIYLRDHTQHFHVSETRAENKHVIPKKSPKKPVQVPHGKSHDKTTADRLISQVKAHSHDISTKTQETRRLTPGH